MTLRDRRGVAGKLGRPATARPGEPTADAVLGEDETPQERPGG